MAAGKSIAWRLDEGSPLAPREFCPRMPFTNDHPLTLAARRFLAGVDLYLLLSLLVLASAAWLFLAIADEVTEGETHRIDASILRLLREPDDLSQTIGPHWLRSVFIDLTALGGVTVLTMVTLVVLGALSSGTVRTPSRSSSARSVAARS